MSSANSNGYAIRSLIVPVFTPSFLFATGETAIVPVLPSIATKLGADLPTAGFVTGLIMAGTVFFDLPAARIVDRIGERRAMILAAVISVFAIAAAYFAPNLWFLGMTVFVAGMMLSVFGLARHGYMTEHVPITHRARALSVLGGMFRAGGFLGPALASVVIYAMGQNMVFILGALFCALSAILLMLTRPDQLEDTPSIEGGNTWVIARREAPKLRTVGVASAILGAIRNTRQIGIPLWGLYLGIHPGAIALYIGIAGAIDLALFYSSGQIMDRWGRRWSMVPNLLLMGLATYALIVAHNEVAFLAVIIFMAVANGLGSGIVLTVGADLAPIDGRNEFLAAYRLLVDSGAALTPIVISSIAAAIALPVALGTMATISLFGAGLAWRYLPKFGIR